MGTPDYVESVDIIAQSIKDLRTKPFWDYYDEEIGSVIIPATVETTLIDLAYQGYVLGGFLFFQVSVPASPTAHLKIIVDGTNEQKYYIEQILKIPKTSQHFPIICVDKTYGELTLKFDLNGRWHFLSSFQMIWVPNSAQSGDVDFHVYLGVNS